MYDFHDDAPVPVLIVRTRINGQCIETSRISASENIESFYSLLHLLGGVHV